MTGSIFQGPGPEPRSVSWLRQKEKAVRTGMRLYIMCVVCVYIYIYERERREERGERRERERGAHT